MTNWWMKVHLETTLFHKLAIAETFFTEVNFKVPPDNVIFYLQLARHTWKDKTLPSQHI